MVKLARGLKSNLNFKVICGKHFKTHTINSKNREKGSYTDTDRESVGRKGEKTEPSDICLTWNAKYDQRW